MNIAQFMDDLTTKLEEGKKDIAVNIDFNKIEVIFTTSIANVELYEELFSIIDDSGETELSFSVEVDENTKVSMYDDDIYQIRTSDATIYVSIL